MSILFQQRYDSLFLAYGDLYKVDWKLLKAIAEVESSLQPRATTKTTSAKGLMQFVHATWEEWGVGDPFNPEASIEAGAKYLRYLFERFDETRLALAAYHGGPTKLARVGYECMPTATKDYVLKVMRHYQ